MKIRRFGHMIPAALTVLLWAAASCSLDETVSLPGEEPAAKVSVQPRHTTFHVSTEEYADAGSLTPQTRVSVDNSMILFWEADDRISIFNQSTANLEYRFDGETGAYGGDFLPVDEGAAPGDLTQDNVYAVYPYMQGTVLADDGTLSVTFPAEQTYRPDAFGPEANVMVAKTSDAELQFRNAGGLLAVSMFGTGIKVKSLVLTANGGETIAGPATVTLAEDGTPTVTLDAASEAASDAVTLSFTNPVTIGTTAAAATVFWLALPPVTFSQGFTLAVNWTDGLADYTFEKVTEKSISLQRNGIIRMAALDGGIVPTAIAINPSAAQVKPGSKIQLTPVFTPANATYNAIDRWTSSKNAIAKVSGTGEVTGVSTGFCYIYCYAALSGLNDVDHRAVCKMSVRDVLLPESVDLGLPNGAKWATFNIGADAPEQAGMYFAWGEIATKASYTLANYGWFANNAMTKYNATDEKESLEKSDDAAYTFFKGNWRLPTMSETAELFNTGNTTWTRTTLNGVSVWQVKSKKNGNSIYLPIAGYKEGSTVKDATFGYYWSSSVNFKDSEDPGYLNAYALKTTYPRGRNVKMPRELGMLVRPVTK